MEFPKTLRYIALFDMDGTLCDYIGALKKDYDKLKLDSDPEFISDLHDNSPAAIKERIDMIRSQDGWWTRLERYKPGFELLELCKSLGFNINILSKGPRKSQNAWTEKLIWCQKEVPGAGVTITLDKSLTYGNILVDDYPRYIKDWLDMWPDSIVIMPVQEWNKTFKHPRVVPYNGNNMDEVKSFIEINLLQNGRF